MHETYLGIRRLLRPASDPLEGTATVLRDHWRAAAILRPGGLFAPRPAAWLRAGSRLVLTSRPHHFTIGGRLIR